MPRDTIRIMYYRELRCLINKIKDFGLNCNGILFGGVVRDNIIGKHYRKIFIDKDLNFDNYWDPTYDIETINRLIIPKDIDIFFKDENNTNLFINEIQSLVKKFNGNISITSINNLNHINYVNNHILLKHKKINIYMYVGNTLTHPGIRIVLDIDIIEIDYARNIRDNILYTHEINSIEPPFYNLDFLSNIFITQKINSSVITRISNCTGTPIDNMEFSDKILKTANIMKDIINMRTQFVSKLDYFNSEFINCYRIIKMIDRTYSWNITNIPFKFINIIDIDIEINDKCCVCLDDIIINESNKEEINNDYKQLIELNTNEKKSNYLHTHCFMSYLRNEQRIKYVDNITKKIECRCPYRNLFNFKNCYKSIEYI